MKYIPFHSIPFSYHVLYCILLYFTLSRLSRALSKFKGHCPCHSCDPRSANQDTDSFLSKGKKKREKKKERRGEKRERDSVPSGVATPAVHARKENKLFGAALFDLRVQATTYRTVHQNRPRELLQCVYCVYGVNSSRQARARARLLHLASDAPGVRCKR